MYSYKYSQPVPPVNHDSEDITGGHRIDDYPQPIQENPKQTRKTQHTEWDPSIRDPEHTNLPARFSEMNPKKQTTDNRMSQRRTQNGTLNENGRSQFDDQGYSDYFQELENGYDDEEEIKPRLTKKSKKVSKFDISLNNSIENQRSTKNTMLMDKNKAETEEPPIPNKKSGSIVQKRPEDNGSVPKKSKIRFTITNQDGNDEKSREQPKKSIRVNHEDFEIEDKGRKSTSKNDRKSMETNPRKNTEMQRNEMADDWKKQAYDELINKATQMKPSTGKRLTFEGNPAIKKSPSVTKENVFKEELQSKPKQKVTSKNNRKTDVFEKPTQFIVEDARSRSKSADTRSKNTKLEKPLQKLSIKLPPNYMDIHNNKQVEQPVDTSDKAKTSRTSIPRTGSIVNKKSGSISKLNRDDSIQNMYKDESDKKLSITQKQELTQTKDSSSRQIKSKNSQTKVGGEPEKIETSQRKTAAAVKTSSIRNSMPRDNSQTHVVPVSDMSLPKSERENIQIQEVQFNMGSVKQEYKLLRKIPSERPTEQHHFLLKSILLFLKKNNKRIKPKYCIVNLNTDKFFVIHKKAETIPWLFSVLNAHHLEKSEIEFIVKKSEPIRF